MKDPNKRGCCLNCGGLLKEVTVCPDDISMCMKDDCDTNCPKQIDKLYCSTCGIYFEVEQ